MNHGISTTAFFGARVSTALPNYPLVKLSLAVIKGLSSSVIRWIGCSLRLIGCVIVSSEWAYFCSSKNKVRVATKVYRQAIWVVWLVVFSGIVLWNGWHFQACWYGKISSVQTWAGCLYLVALIGQLWWWLSTWNIGLVWFQVGIGQCIYGCWPRVKITLSA